ncbi:nucleoside hydrolase [Virgibacillus xinjiangensis]|uniref:Nucleoside hydrolase n=1 Tax=Virgibacillus xinjiangensis TaxID=393090 RepID=A0ABV7CXX5_9BACI
MGKKVLLFCDVGIDDSIALIYAYLNDDIDIIGIVADYGNVPRTNALATVRYLQELFGVTTTGQIPIIAGAERPMTGDLPDFVPEIHGEYGLGPIIPSNNGEEMDEENFLAITDIIREYQDELIVVNIGRLTSLAALFLTYPQLMATVKRYYVMGGAFWVPGNVTAVSEANFYGDPAAAQIVLLMAQNLTIVPLNVTERAIATPRMIDYIDEVGQIKMVKPLLDYYYDFYKKRNPAIQGVPLHDVLTLMAVLHDAMLSYQYFPLHVVQARQGTERGQSIADIRPYGSLEDETEKEVGVHRIAFGIDYHRFYTDFMSVLTKQRF